MYKVKQRDLIGEVKDFPIEVVQKMLERQVEQGYTEDIKAFQDYSCSTFYGFDWSTSEEGHSFWDEVIFKKNFDLFFKKYPKINTRVYYRGAADRGDEIIAELEKLGGVNSHDYDGCSEHWLYFISPITKTIGFCLDNNVYFEFLKDAYTEIFLPEKIEFIKIDGKKYKKEDVINRIKELKEEI